MKNFSKIRLLLISSLFILNSFLFSAVCSSASEIPEALPSVDLPALSNYQSAYSRSYGTLPSSYDSRAKGYVSPVRNQEPWGTCWAFGALAAGEANLIKDGLADTSLDLSELHLSYFFFNSPNDPLGNTEGDKVTYPSYEENYLESGGNNLFTMFALSKWLGAASEDLVPYSTDSAYIPTVNDSLAYEDVAHLQNARFVSTGDIDSVKKLIMEYGAVSSAMYFDSRYLSDSNAYYYPKVSASNNHIVTLVGWDDDYATYHFSGTAPASSGAWIAKNSYGSDFGDNGYFYISYEDMTLCNQNDARSYAFDMEPADNYDHNYQYDGSFSASVFSVSNGSSFSNIYTVNGNPGGREKLEAVSFSLFTTNVSYSIQIYKNPDPGEPESGTAMLKTPQTGSTTYCGYYTIPLTTQPVFEQGDTFSVVLTLTAADQSTVDMFVDHTSNTAGIQFTSSVSKYQSFYKTIDTWKDLKTKKTTARIKAFTSDTTEAATSTNGKVSSSKYLATPRIKKAYSSAYNEATLIWTAVDNAKGYKIYRSTSKNGPYVRITNTTKTRFTDTKRKSGTTYYYRIRAYRSSGSKVLYSAYSNIVKVRVQPGKTTIKGLKYVNNDTRIKLTWKKVSGANGYVLYRSTSKNGKYKKVKIIKSSSATSCLLKPPASGKRYYYKLRAYRTVNGKRILGAYSSAKSIYVK